jgi:hypothetical protein
LPPGSTAESVFGLPEMSRDREIPGCLRQELNGRSLVDRILEIQKDYAMKDDRHDTSDNWFRRLQCLSVDPPGGKVLKRAVRGPENGEPRDFVAVSYSFKSADESLNLSTLGFEIHDWEDKSIQKVKTRDIVLERVLEYAKAVKTRFFWIDQECFDQEDPDVRQAAMDSMDLVYRKSRYPVALLEVVLTSDQVDLMDILMSGMSSGVPSDKVDSMVDMLRHVQTDRWWERAWTFQEEYLSGRKLKLLIRHDLGRDTQIGSKLGCIKGEVCVSGIDFRDRATRFLLELYNNKATDGGLRDTCGSLLDTLRRYSVVAETTESAMGRAMSSSVLEDLERRAMKNRYDFMPIAANLCGYGIRLRSTQAQCSRRHSVGLCALAMYLLNGEIFFNDGRISVLPTEMGLSQYIGYISFNRFLSPSQDKTLSWLKQCRLRQTRLSAAGIHSSGHLWRVDTEIKTTKWIDSSPKTDDGGGSGLREGQRDQLFELMDELEQRGIYEGLWHKLGRFLEHDETIEGPQTYAREYMNTMAGDVVDAIHCGRSLYLATLEEPPKTSKDERVSSSPDAFSNEYDSNKNEGWSGYAYQDEAFAIFVLDDHDHDDDGAEPDFYVFTSSSGSHHVSMTVDVGVTHMEPSIPLMTITGWTNGLAFYYGVSTQETVFRWPEAWQEVQQLESRKRKRSTHTRRKA